MQSNELMELCCSLHEDDRPQLLMFIRFLRSVPEFSAELHALAAPGEHIPPLEVTEAVMEKYKGRLNYQRKEEPA